MNVLVKDIIKRIKIFFEVNHCKNREKSYNSKIKLYLNENAHGTFKNVKYDKKIFITISTKGTIMNESLLKLIKDYYIGLQISIDGDIRRFMM